MYTSSDLQLAGSGRGAVPRVEAVERARAERGELVDLFLLACVRLWSRCARSRSWGPARVAKPTRGSRGSTLDHTARHSLLPRLARSGRRRRLASTCREAATHRMPFLVSRWLIIIILFHRLRRRESVRARNASRSGGIPNPYMPAPSLPTLYIPTLCPHKMRLLYVGAT